MRTLALLLLVPGLALAQTGYTAKPQVCGPAGTHCVDPTNTTPASNAYALPVRQIGSSGGWAGPSDTTATATLNGVNVAVTVAAAGQQAAGIQFITSSLLGTVIPEFSIDGGTTWATTFAALSNTGVSTNSISSPTAGLVYEIMPVNGATHYRFRVGTYTSGSASVAMAATTTTHYIGIFGTDGSGLRPIRTNGNGDLQVAPSPGNSMVVAQASGANLRTQTASESNAGGSAPSMGSLSTGKVTTAAPTYTNATHDALSLQTDGSLRVAVTSGGGSNSSVGTTGAAVPGSATYAGMNVGGNLTGLAGTANGLTIDGAFTAAPTNSPPSRGLYLLGGVTTGAPTYTNGTVNALSLDTAGALRVTGSLGNNASVGTVGSAVPASATNLGAVNAGNLSNLQADASGNLMVNVAAGGASGGTSSTFGAAFPSAGTAAGFKDSNGINMQPGNLDASGNLKVAIATSSPSGSLVVQQATGSNLHAVLDSGSTTAVTQATGTNLHTVVDSGTVTANAGTGSFTVVQSTGTNLHAVLDGGTAVIGGVKLIDTAGTNQASISAAGAVKVDGSAVTQPVSGTFWQATQPVSGTVTSNQGTAAAGSGAWPVTVTEDTTNTVVKPGDATNKAIRVNVVAGGGSGGTSSSFAAAFPATGTAAGAKVVTSTPTYTNGNMEGLTMDASGNLRVAGSFSAGAAADTTASGTLGALNATVSVAMAGQQSVSVIFTSGLVGTVKPQVSYDGGTTWQDTTFRSGTVSTVYGALADTVVNPASGAAYGIVLAGGVSHARVIVSAYTSGSCTAAVRAVAIPDQPLSVMGFGQAANVGVPIAGNNSGAAQAILATPQGELYTAIRSGGVAVTVTGANALKVDGSAVTQPVSAASLPLPTGAATESTLSTLNGKVPSGLTVTSTRLLTDGSGVTQPVSGTVTANVGTTNGLALDATLTGGTTKAITRGGAKGATAAADVTSTANGADHQGLDVQIQNASIPVTGTFWQATQPVSISGNQAVNVAQINGVTPLMGNGVTGTGSQRVTIASDNTPVAFKTDQTTHGTTDKVAADVTLVNGTAPTADNGTAGTTNLHVLPAIVETSSTMPTRTDGNRAALIVDAKGRLVTRISSTNPWSCAQSGITALTECKALTASTVHYVTHVVLSNGPTAQTLQIVYGTGTNCGTGQTALTSTIYLGVNGGAVIPFDSSPLAPASGNAICCKPSGATAFSCTLAGYSE